MTEQQWLVSGDPVPMLESVASPQNERKLRLFLCACCHRVLETAAGRRSSLPRGWDVCLGMLRGALTTVEQYADGLCGTRGLETAWQYAKESEYVPSYIDYGGESGLGEEASAVRHAADRLLTPKNVAPACRDVLATLRQDRRRALSLEVVGPPDPRYERELVAWVRDIFGNPFRPVAVDPAWRTADALLLAEGIYADRAFDRLPVLADALQDAGCDHPDILGHCREPGAHVRGCWVLDLFIEAPRRFALAAAPAPPEVKPPPAPTRPQLRPGDWLCRGCNAHNFARRDTCLRCNRPRPAPELRDGDWICPGCRAHNFARRETCHQCRAARPAPQSDPES